MTMKSRQGVLTLIYIVLLGLGLSFETAIGDRMLRMLMLGILSGGIFFMPSRPKLQTVWSVGTFLLLAGLESQSKYTVNYLFHLLYVVVLASCYLNGESKAFRVAVASMAAASSYKYLYLLTVDYGSSDFGQAGVLMTITLLVAVMLMLSLRLKEERNDVMALNKKLHETMAVLETMTLFKERNRVSRELHDTLGHELTALIMKMELSKHLKHQDPQQSDAYLTEAIEEGRSALKLVRSVVQALKQPNRSNDDLIILVERFKQITSMRINLICELELSEMAPEQAHVIYRAVQEALTNAVRHSQANQFWIELKPCLGGIALSLNDDGALNDPTQALQEGFGLRAMRERVEELNGKMRIERVNGFAIQIVFETLLGNTEEAYE